MSFPSEQNIREAISNLPNLKKCEDKNCKLCKRIIHTSIKVLKKEIKNGN